MTQERDTKAFLSDTKFYEGYSRYIESENRYETWNEAVDRVMSMHKKKYKNYMSPELMEYMNFSERLYKEKRVLGAQRALQFGGEQLLNHQMRRI